MIGPVSNYRPSPRMPSESDESLRARRRAEFEAHQMRKNMRKLEIAREKEEKAKASRTCQICARAIFAESGLIAHHGYKRPGDGQQTASCYGARQLPFERSRAVLGRLIQTVIIPQRDKARAEAEAIQNETRAPYFEVPGAWFTQRIEVTRESFSWCYAVKLARSKYRPPAVLLTFEALRDNCAALLEREAETLENERKQQQARFDAWTQIEGAK